VDLNNLAWRKSSFSGDNGGNCVEVASQRAVVAMRDSKRPEAGALLLSKTVFARLIGRIVAE
jgi:hypothetical protein